MMAGKNEQATTQFRRMMMWIGVAAVLMVVGALAFLDSVGSLSLHAAIATVLGVFFSTLLGCGLFALAFFSDKSGHDENVSETTSRQDKP